MKFILTQCSTEEKQSVTRECVDRIKGKHAIDAMIRKVEETGNPVEVHFEGEYDLMVAKEGM